MKLSEVAVRKAKAKAKPVKLTDGLGLYLLVTPAGSKLWRWKYRHDGKEKLMALGAYPDVSLAQARQKVLSARSLHASGADPMEVRRTEKLERQHALENSFETVARKWWAQWKAGRSDSHADYVLRRLEADVFPAIGRRPVGDVQAPDLVRVVKAVAGRGAEDVAKRVLQTTGQVFRYAIAHGLCQRNPASEIRPADIFPSRRKKNYARVPASELPQLLRRIDAYHGAATTRLAMKLMALTFVRTKELIGARWSEFDLDKRRWDVPSSRMKMKTPHIVPLSDQAVEVLKTLHVLTGHSELLFPGERDHEVPMSNNTILGALKRMGYQGRMTGHGFRGIASTVLHEHGFEHAHIELQLAHQQRNAVSAAYNHATHLGERTSMMQAWADYLDKCRSGGKDERIAA
jgi:integrase